MIDLAHRPILRSTLGAAVLCVTCLLCVRAASAQNTPAQNPPSHDSVANSQNAMQTMDGGVGPCAVILTVTSDSKPVFAANVKVHIEYGFAGIRRLDLEAY